MARRMPAIRVGNLAYGDNLADVSSHQRQLILTHLTKFSRLLAKHASRRGSVDHKRSITTSRAPGERGQAYGAEAIAGLLEGAFEKRG